MPRWFLIPVSSNLPGLELSGLVAKTIIFSMQVVTPFKTENRKLAWVRRNFRENLKNQLCIKSNPIIFGQIKDFPRGL